jgi:hypothetical protein
LREGEAREDDGTGDILSAKIGLLQLDELCAHVLSRKLASGEVERCANGTMRSRERWITGLIAFSVVLGGRSGVWLWSLWSLGGWGKVVLIMLVRLRWVREGVHG